MPKLQGSFAICSRLTLITAVGEALFTRTHPCFGIDLLHFGLLGFNLLAYSLLGFGLLGFDHFDLLS